MTRLNTDVETNQDSNTRLVPYPQLSGANWPSYLLQAWLTLHGMGVPEKNIRFLPEVGHFALPEVVEESPEEDWERHSTPMEWRHPRGTQYDASTGRATVQEVSPDTIRPRLKVNVRADWIWPEASYSDVETHPQQVGRLAHFMEPLLAGLPIPAAPNTQETEASTDVTLDGSDEAATQEGRERTEKPLAKLTRQICIRYPELLRAVPLEVKNVLSAWTEHVLRALESESAEARTRWLQQAARLIPDKMDASLVADWFADLSARLPFPEEWSAQDLLRATNRLREWGGGLALDTPEQRAEHSEAIASALEPGEREQQRVALQLMMERLAQETSRERYRIVRELVEILTTEAFTSVAVLDYLWGIGWIHGQADAFRLPIGEPSSPGVFLSFTGGINQRTLLLLLIQRWLKAEGFLGVVSHAPATPPTTTAETIPDTKSVFPPFSSELDTLGSVDRARDTILAELCDTDLLDASERQELWLLVAWRRESPDPLLLLQTAAQRLIHPDVLVKWDHYFNVGGGFNTLFSQPGATAALGGMVQVHYPGVTIYMPLSEDEDEIAMAAKARLNLLLRLFLPICLRADVVWKESVARLGEGSYLQHPYQGGVRMAT